MLRAWADSPARFREDANAEEDLRIGGYRDRVLVELAQNAADAADAAGGDGEFAFSVVDGELRAANTGAPLDAAGVASLASLRASAKRGRDTSGHFGVGFAAVLSVTDTPSVHSLHGGVRFSAAGTREAVAGLADAATVAAHDDGDASTLEGELAARAGAVPVLRLPWPADGAVPNGFATEVRLPLFDEVDAAALLEQARQAAPELLLAFPALRAITVDGERITAEHAGELVTIGQQRWVVARTGGQLDARSGLGVEHTGRYAVTWAVPVDEAGAPQPLGEDVLHTPTPTDERLSLPARLLAFVPMEPNRRRVREGAATEAVLAAAVQAYPQLLRRFPAGLRLGLVPRPGFPASEVDARLREGLLERCRTEPLLPAADGSEIAASGALALAHRSEPLRSLLADALPGLLGDVGDEVALRALGVRRIGPADIAEAVLGLQRSPSWWHELYAALAEGIDAGADREELGALPVPMLDGRTLPGPRGALLPDRSLTPFRGLDALELPIVHPDAVHPLLTRLGAVTAGPGELLDTDELRARVERSVEAAAAGLDTTDLADVVLRLVGETADGRGLGALALRDVDNLPRRADELLFPDAALRPVLDRDAVGPDEPLAVLATDLVDAYPREALAAVGVLDGFAVVTDEDPAGPDHGLPDEDQWWQTGPRVLHGIRDLDLVHEQAWEPALAAIAAEPHTWHALAEPGGYTGWWIARYATLAGHEPRYWALPGASGLAGLYEPLPSTRLPEATLIAAGVRTELSVQTTDDAAELLDRLADRSREPAAGTVLDAHTRLAMAVRDGRLDPAEVPAPAAVRAVDGHVAAEQALVADTPWLAGSGLGELVVLPTELAEPLAALLDVPLASAELDTAVSGTGEPAAWAGFAAVVATCGLLGLPVPDGAVVLHDPLVVTIDGARFEPPWWVEGGTVHACDDERGLARALAWCAGVWADRYRVESLLRDPGLGTLLG